MTRLRTPKPRPVTTRYPTTRPDLTHLARLITKKHDCELQVEDLLRIVFELGELRIATEDENPALPGPYHNAIETARDNLASIRVLALGVIDFDGWFKEFDK